MHTVNKLAELQILTSEAISIVTAAFPESLLDPVIIEYVRQRVLLVDHDIFETVRALEQSDRRSGENSWQAFIDHLTDLLHGLHALSLQAIEQCASGPSKRWLRLRGTQERRSEQLKNINQIFDSLECLYPKLSSQSPFADVLQSQNTAILQLQKLSQALEPLHDLPRVSRLTLLT